MAPPAATQDPRLSALPLPAGAVEVRSITELFELHADDVARWAQRLGGPSIDVEDVVQDVFLVAQRKWAAFRGEAKPSTWLFRVTHHVVRARRRRRSFAWLSFGPFKAEGVREAERELDPDAHEPALADPTPGAEEQLSRRQADAQVHRALDRLNDRYRTVLVLFELEELSGQEIAELLGIRVDAVWVCLHRARKAFARELERLAVEEAR